MTAKRISATELADRLSQPGLRVIDATVFLSFPDGQAHIEPGGESFLAEHVPGAVFADLTSPGFSDHGVEAPFAAVPSATFADTVGALGVGDGDTVVVYDRVNGIWATRLWWQFQLEGHDDVRILDGGLAAWKAAGLPVEAGEAEVSPATFTARRRPERVASTDEVLAATGDERVLLIEALDERLYQRGHIPSAVNVPAASLVQEDGTLKSLDELREIFAAVGALDPGVRPIAYCGGGIAATAVTFALAELGRDDVAVYDGSKNAWTADPSRPLVSS